MAIDYALDIETYPDVGMIGKLPEPEISKVLKDPAKIEAAKIEAKEKQLQDMALNPLYGKIAAYTFFSSDVEDVWTIYNGCSDNEIQLLYEIRDILYDKETKTTPFLITWNGTNFDLPFIYKRFILNDIQIKYSLSYWTKKYNETHIDLMQVWAGYGKYEKLDTVCKAIFGYGKKEFDFRKIPELITIEAGKDKILEYNTQDARLVFDLYNKFNGILF